MGRVRIDFVRFEIGYQLAFRIIANSVCVHDLCIYDIPISGCCQSPNIHVDRQMLCDDNGITRKIHRQAVRLLEFELTHVTI
jgi:hypothetical protein